MFIFWFLGHFLVFNEYFCLKRESRVYEDELYKSIYEIMIIHLPFVIGNLIYMIQVFRMFVISWIMLYLCNLILCPTYIHSFRKTPVSAWSMGRMVFFTSMDGWKICGLNVGINNTLVPCFVRSCTFPSLENCPQKRLRLPSAALLTEDLMTDVAISKDTKPGVEGLGIMSTWMSQEVRING